IRHPAEPIPASKNDFSSHSFVFKLPIADQRLQRFVVAYGKNRNQCISGTACHQVPERFQAGRMKLSNVSTAICGTEIERLVSKAMSVFQENHTFAIQVAPI